MTDKINSELFILTYGALVSQVSRSIPFTHLQLVADAVDQDNSSVNEQLDKMGFSIGTRLIEDFLARSNVTRCSDFKETADVVRTKHLALILLDQ